MSRQWEQSTQVQAEASALSVESLTQNQTD